MSVSVISCPSGLRFTSELSSMKFAVSYDRAYVTVYGSSARKLYEEFLYPYNGILEIDNIRDIVESDMKSRNSSLSRYRLDIELLSPSAYQDDAITVYFDAVFCDRDTLGRTAVEFCKTNFLTSSPLRAVSQNTNMYLSFVTDSGERTAVITVNALTESGKMVSSAPKYIDLGESKELSLKTFFINQETVSPILSTLYHKDPSVKATDITVKVGDRSATFYFDGSLEKSTQFVFRNCFNVPETVCLNTSSVEEQTVKCSITEMNRLPIQYDKSVSETINCETAPQHLNDARWLKEFLAADEVYVLLNSGELRDIIITDSTCEISDNNETLNSLKFSYRFVAGAPPVSLPAISPGVFSDEFTEEFS